MSVGYLKKCTSNGKPKAKFLTQAAAEAFRTSLVKLGRWTYGGSNTYWCNQCGFYHAGKLGRANRGKGRKVAAKNRPRHLDCQ
jgi:hypothetical protein